jgi:hypothetical protein
MTHTLKAVALDLEGTLVDTVHKPLARPGLDDFLTFCRGRFERLYLYTAARNERALEVLDELAARGTISRENRAALSAVDWPHNQLHKDLRYIRDYRVEEILFIDDDPLFVRPEQKSQWLPIDAGQGREGWDGDNEFARIMAAIVRYQQEGTLPHGEGITLPCEPRCRHVGP